MPKAKTPAAAVTRPTTYTRYLVTTPANPNYQGKTFFVQFHDGRAILDANTLPRRSNFKPTLAELVRMFQTDLPGYEVRPIPAAPLDADSTLFAPVEAEAVQADPLPAAALPFIMAEGPAAPAPKKRKG